MRHHSRPGSIICYRYDTCTRLCLGIGSDIRHDRFSTSIPMVCFSFFKLPRKQCWYLLLSIIIYCSHEAMLPRLMTVINGCQSGMLTLESGRILASYLSSVPLWIINLISWNQGWPGTSFYVCNNSLFLLCGLAWECLYKLLHESQLISYMLTCSYLW